MDDIDKKKLELVKLKMAFQQQLDDCFDPNDLNSRPSKEQEAFLKNCSDKVIFVVAANRCLEEGTLVATPKGPVAIEDIVIGDVVYDENGKEIEVLNTFYQGEKEVVDLYHRTAKQASCTDNHVWLAECGRGNRKELKTEDIKKDWKIVRTEIEPSMGNVTVPSAYELGALLGDGCSREMYSTGIRISSGSHHIPKYMNSEAVKLHENNYTWNIGNIDVAYYNEWCKGRYAHEKIVDLEIVKQWDRESIIKLIAGLIDTDGSITYCKKYNLLDLGISMQSKSCIEFMQWAILALYQHQCNIILDDRPKYKNGPCHGIKLRNSHIVRRLWKDINKYIQSPHKKYKSEYDKADTPRYNPNKIGIVKKGRRRVRCYDIHVNSSTNLYLLANGLVTHNSGKTAAAARAVSWWFQGKHPYYKPKKKWGDKFNILIVGRTTEILETEIWEKKIKPFLPAGCWKIKSKSGGGIAGVRNVHTGINLVFMSHHDAKNAREKVQGFTAPIVWVDEMPDDSSLITELMLRTSTEGGLFMATFTPLVENEQVRKIVDSKDANKTCYRFLPQDNPKLMEEFGSIDAYASWLQAQCASDAEFRARMYGEWYYRSGRVIRAFDPESHLISPPEIYEPKIWPHVLVVDPSASGLTGVSIWAHHPLEETWFCVLAKKIEGDAAFLLVKTIEEMAAPYNIIKRVCDCNPAGFYREAHRQEIHYDTMNDKTDRRNHTIEQVNERFASNIIYLTKEAQELADECLGAKWSETNPDKMINATNYHLIDTLRYFVDRCPNMAKEKPVVYNNSAHMAKQEFRKQLKEREKRKEKSLQKKEKSYKILKRSKRRRSRYG